MILSHLFIIGFDASLNTCYNAVDRHVLSGRGNQIAIIYDSPVTNVKKKITYEQLQSQIIQFSGALKKLVWLKAIV